MQLTGQNNGGIASSAFLFARKYNWLASTWIMNMRNATSVGTQTSKVLTRVTLLFIPYTVQWCSECRSRGSQILWATNIVVLVNVCNSSLSQLMTSVTRVTFTQITYESPPLGIDIRVPPKIWESRDQHSPGSFTPARSVEKRAWVRGWLPTS